jgi:uncharacterized membrane protein
MTSSARPAQPAAAAPADRARSVRVQSLDILRGLVMVIMALDHTRDYVHAAAMAFQPEDLSRTTVAIFMTRWVTHFCAPVFMLLAGAGAYLRLCNHGTRADLSRFLLARGLWLIALEFTVVRAGFFFDVTGPPFILLVLWALGMSMMALAALVHLPYRVLLAASVTLMAAHNLFDGLQPARFGALGWVWQILHVQGPLMANPPVIVAYPLVPWIGVMAAGYCFGRLHTLNPERRRRVLWRLGLALTAAFVVLRAINLYGDPRPWRPQDSPLFTALSFLNTTKYPPSLSFLLMTLGPAMLFLAAVDRVRVGDRHPLVVFGRVPLWYFVLHIPLVHAFAIGLTWWRYGNAPFLWLAPPTLGTPREAFPPDYGWDLWVAYAVTVTAVLVLYPICQSGVRSCISTFRPRNVEIQDLTPTPARDRRPAE